MTFPKSKLNRPKLVSLAFLITFLLILASVPSYSIFYYVTFVKLDSMIREAQEKRDLTAETIFKEIKKQKNDADQFYFDPNDDKYEVYVDTPPKAKRFGLSKSDELRIIDYHQKIRHKKEATSFVYWLGIAFMPKANFIEEKKRVPLYYIRQATRIFEYTKISDPFFLPSYCSLFTLYRGLGEEIKANQNLNELKNRFLILRQYDPNYMVVVPQESVILPHIKEIPEKIENTQLLEVEIQKRRYTVLANTDLDPPFVREKAYLYAPFMFDLRETSILFPFPKERD